jgi:hypothetical protein
MDMNNIFIAMVVMFGSTNLMAVQTAIRAGVKFGGMGGVTVLSIPDINQLDFEEVEPLVGGTSQISVEIARARHNGETVVPLMLMKRGILDDALPEHPSIEHVLAVVGTRQKTTVALTRDGGHPQVSVLADKIRDQVHDLIESGKPDQAFVLLKTYFEELRLKAQQKK